MRRAISILAAILAIGSGVTRASAQCEIPLVIGSAGSTANVLILLDTSGSMNEVVTHDSYNPATNYSGNFNVSSTYNIANDGTYTPRTFNSAWPNTPSAYLVDSDQGEDGEYSGNYLNWIYFRATSAQRAAIPTYTRIQTAKSVVNTVLNDMTAFRFAIARFNGLTGGSIIAPFGTAIAAMQSTVNSIRAESRTPLAESMETALNYFTQTGASAPIQAACQKSFVILITDGLPTDDLNVSSYLRSNDCGANDSAPCTGTGCSSYLDNVACYMYRNDLRNDLAGIQNVATFVIGFGVDGTLLQVTANEGGGEYFTTSNTAGLVSALAQTFNNISRRTAAGSSAAVVAAEDRLSNRLFRARYESGVWKGYVEAFNLPYQAGSPAWEAGSLLAARTADSRTIYTTSSGTSLVTFTSGNASSLRTLLGAVDNTEATNIIQYVRGNAITGTRDRGGWKLGDIVDAAPVAVGKPTGFSSVPGYAAFRAANATRQEVLYVAANDGMLHCFDASNGAELWAYIPKTQLPRLRNLLDPAYCHQYFLNTTPVVTDVLIGTTWKTVLIAGEEGSGNGMFALDVTNPNAMSVLWDVNVTGLRGSTNPPTLVRDRTLNAHVLCVGTGYSSTSAGDTLVVLSPSTGAVLNRVGLGSAVAGNKTTRATAFDRNFDGYDDLLYIADLAGRVFRVDLTTNPWTKTQIFSCGQPIQAPPVVTMNALGRPMLFFGTGQFLVASDPGSTATQTIYGIVDDGSSTNRTPADLVDQTSTINAVSTSTLGWYLNLVRATGERTTKAAALVNGTLYVPSYKPSTTSCSGGDQSWLYTLDYKDGSKPDNPNGTANQVTTGRSASMGDGMLADPTVDLVNEAILLQSSNAVVLTQGIPGGLRRLVVRGWHQKWN